MRFVTFRRGDVPRAGLLTHDGSRIVDLAAAAERYRGAIGGLGTGAFGSVLDVIRAGDDAVAAARRLVELAGSDPALSVTAAGADLLAPIPRPAKNVFCVGLNYAEHTKEFTGGQSNLPSAPIIFSKAPTAVIGPGADIQIHPGVTEQVDYEAELGVVIGKPGRGIPKDGAWDHIFGYTIINDVTARDLQKRHQQWFLGKSLDTFCPTGPHLVHRSAVPRADRLDIASRVNGETRQSSNTRYLIFDIPTLISTLSAGMTLEPGDIIATGTCAGVGMGFNPPKFMKPGDVVEVEIEGLGVLRNRVV